MARAKSLLFVSVLALVVAACGGGGDSGASSANSPGADDTIAPTTPAGLVATAAGATVVNLTWSASTDNVGVTGYIVKRNGTPVGMPFSPTYADTELTSATTYNYTVAARDAAGNVSADSAVLSVTTADATPPSTPTGVVATAAGATAINLSWIASTDNVGVTGYIVKRNGTPVGTPTSTSFADTSLLPGFTYSYTVAARDAAGNVSPESASASATTIDTIAPSTPTGLVATAAGGSVVNLMWSASSDNVGVTAYIVKRNGAQVATPITTSYSDTGLSDATTYSYTVAARDAAGNFSANSAIVSATTPDATPPSAPAGLMATAAGSAAINLTWTASNDNVGVTGYIVKRNHVQVGPPTTATSYADTGLTAATTYTYTVAARDAAGNVSSESTSASATTTNAADTTPPSTPTDLVATVAGATTINLSWNASTDNIGVTGYIVNRNGVQRGTSSSASFADTGLTAGTTYIYTVAARDAAGNVSGNSTNASATIPDTTAPSTPTGVTATAAGATTINLAWNASTDDVGVTGYIVRRNGAPVGTPTTTSFADTGLLSGLTQSYTVAARDAAGNFSPESASVEARTADTIAPSTPSGLVASAAGASTINLTWSASTDNVGVTGYIVKRNGTPVATPTTTSYSDTGLSGATTYNYTVSASDAANNISPESAIVSATTADATPPAVPTGLVATAAGATAINLTWTASTDNVGVTGYIVRRNGMLVGTPTSTSFADTSLLSGFTYSYTVAARDAAGNVSSDSASASATTIDTIAPSTPTGLVATAAGGSVVNLMWSASSDNVGVTGYIVRRDGVQVATPSATNYADTGLSVATTYSYTVAARDAANNVSSESTSVSVTTADTLFPLVVSVNRRYLQDQNGVPFPIMGRTAWFLTSLSVADYRTFIDDTAARGYSAIEFHVVNHDPRGNNPPRNGNGALPFLKRLDGGVWDGSLTYGLNNININNEAPDFTIPNEAYWSFVDALLAYSESKGLLVFLFPAYVGAAGTDEGWMQELVANGPTKMQSYGVWIASRYANQKNLVWMAGGDMGSFTTAQSDVENALLTGLRSVAGQSVEFSAEWSSEMNAADQEQFGSLMTLNGVYWWNGAGVSSNGRRAYARTPIMPAFLLEEPYDEEGPDGNSVNSDATQPVRRFQWWGWLATIGGYISGNGYVWPFNPGWQLHLDTQGSRDMKRLNAFIRSVAWYNLAPSGLGGMRTLITAGGGSCDSSDNGSNSNCVAAAATPDGTLLVAYIPPAYTGSITVDMAALGGLVRARWFDPTDGTYRDAGTGLANTGLREFPPPGTNGTGQNDWVLVLEAN